MSATDQKLSHDLGRQDFGDEKNIGNVLSKKEAISLMKDWVENERLQLHMLQVGTVLGAWARERLNLSASDQMKWEVTGVLHDADWDKWPDEHCKRIIEHLEEEDTDPEILHAIASHSPSFFGVEPVNDLDHMLYAVDELSGFIHAVSLVRPGNYEGMKAKSVKKKLKEKSFAAQVNREDISDAISRIDLELDELINFIIEHQAGVSL